MPKGIALCGVSGSGKSLFAKALGNETGRPCLRVDFGAVLGSKVGESEANFREMLRRIDRMSPCVAWVVCPGGRRRLHRAWPAIHKLAGDSPSSPGNRGERLRSQARRSEE
jgi:hypothetical protein